MQLMDIWLAKLLVVIDSAVNKFVCSASMSKMVPYY